MAEILRLPRMSDTMEEGVIAEIHVKEGDKLSSGDVIAEVETDKATMEWESFQEGTILHLAINKGDAVPVNGVVAVIGEKGEDFAELLANAGNEASASKEEPAAAEEAAAPAVAESAPAPAVSAPAASSNNGTTNGRIKASPLARKIAQEKGLELSMIQGSGDDGRIIKRDVESASPMPAVSAAISGKESYEEVPVSQMRKTIAKRLAESKYNAPHFYLTIELDMDGAIAARKQMNEHSPVKISFNDIIMKAAASALTNHPAVNSSWLGDRIRYNHHVHMGMAVAVDEGLVVPVIKFAHEKSLAAIASETRAYAEKARDKKIMPEDMVGNTFTVSNLGMMGIEEFTAIINPPDACILAIGGIKQVPKIVDGEVKVGNVMKVTLSCDHRVVDGASGARFLQEFKQKVEQPVTMLI